MNNKTVPVEIAEAIASDDDSLSRLLLDNPDQINAHTFMAGQTWLGYAAQKGSLKSVITLLELGFDKDVGARRDGYGPICSAAHHGHLDVVKYLLGCRAKLDISSSARNPIFCAIVGRSPQIVRLLLEAGVDGKVRYTSDTMSNMDAVAFALMRGETECARAIAEWNANGDEEAVKLALDEADRIANENAKK